jgi:thiosulfate dehydrogenase [quinone] large subunit
MAAVQTPDSAARALDSHTVVMDREGRIRIPRAGAITAAILRIGIGLIYLWGFISAGFGVHYTNQVVDNNAPAPQEVQYHWDFEVNTDDGWITSGFSHSPTEGYVDNNTHGPLAFIPQNLPVGLDDFGWMFAIGGLGIALTLGICSRIAGWGGFLLNIMIWFATFPPSTNPIFDAEHFMFAFILLLLMWLHASNYWGIGRWWRGKTPAFLH